MSADTFAPIDRARVSAVRSFVRAELADLAGELLGELAELDLAAVAPRSAHEREDFLDRRGRADLSRWTQQQRFTGPDHYSPDMIGERWREYYGREVSDDEAMAGLVELWDREAAAKALAADRRPQFAHGLALSTEAMELAGLTSDFLWADWADAASAIADADESLAERRREAERRADEAERYRPPLLTMVSRDRPDSEPEPVTMVVKIPSRRTVTTRPRPTVLCEQCRRSVRRRTTRKLGRFWAVLYGRRWTIPNDYPAMNRTDNHYPTNRSN